MSALGDIWSTGAFATESPLKDLLDSNEYTLEDLLAQDELLQEVRGLDQRLLKFLATPNTVTQIVHHITQLPWEQKSATEEKETSPQEESSDNNAQDSQVVNTQQETPFDSDTVNIRFPYVACEIVCCEVLDILDLVVNGTVPTEDSTATAVAQLSPTNGDAVEVIPTRPTRILDHLFDLVMTTNDTTSRLDDYRTGYFEKILMLLFRTRPIEMTEYLNEGGRWGQEKLMEGLVRHLYSNSIAQIVQRLLLPPRPQATEEDEEEEEKGEDDDLQIIQGQTDEGITVDWTKTGFGLDLLLDSLIEPPQTNELDRFHQSWHATEVLLTIIQNSLLSSPTMLHLTNPTVLERLVEAVQVPEQLEPGETLLTCYLSVIETIILQLGGYGAVGTMTLLDVTEEEPAEVPLIADIENFLQVLPALLEKLSQLLRHESCQEWTCQFQFSENPQPLLGTIRLRIIRVLEALVLLGDADVDDILVESDCVLQALDLFWEFQWCSMLHQSVANLLVHVLEGRNARIRMQEYFLHQGKLLGRLMDSFHGLDLVAEGNTTTRNKEGDTGTATDESTDDKEAPEDMDVDEKPQVDEADSGSVEVEDGSEDRLPVTQDDVDAAAALPAQTFRYGYMGHVIIICQSLVHACSPEGDEEEEQGEQDQEQLEDDEEIVLASMVASHELFEQWDEFVAGTLTSETLTQSMPLGGFVMTDPMQAHRPGLQEEDAMLGAATLELDETDLDIAANMMAKLGLGPSRNVDDGDDGVNDTDSSGDSERSYNSGETNNSGGPYMFDDPLGKTGGLGLELGKLTQYAPEVANGSDDGEEADKINASSSEEEGEEVKDDEAPVMDLFAGNLGDETPAEPIADFSPDFANFDAATFDMVGSPVEEDVFGDFESAADGSNNNSSSHSEIEEMFGKGDHFSILENDEDPAPSSPTPPVLDPSDDARIISPNGHATDDAKLPTPDETVPVSTTTIQ